MFLTPLRQPTLSQWFADSPIGKNTLAATVKNLMKEAGFEGTYSNHSCRRTAVTRIITATKDTSLAKAATGHKSSAVSEYDESASSSSRLISKILQSKSVSINAHRKTEQKMTITSGAEGSGNENENGVKIKIVNGDFQMELSF